jgi:hypothetical protein
MRAGKGARTRTHARRDNARCRSESQELLSPRQSFFPQRRLFETPLLASSTFLYSSTKMASKQAKSENQQSLKVLEELLAKLNVSKAQDEINGVSQEIAIFINGDIEEEDAPTK